MRICRSAITLAIFVRVMAAAVLGSVPRATAQERPVPPFRPANGPNAATENIVRQRVRTALASALDPGLPPQVFDDWLFTTLAPLMDVPWRPVDWRVRFCDHPEFPMREGSAELCVDASTQVTAGKVVHIVVAAAEPVVDSDGRMRWRPVQLSVRDVFVERIDAGVHDSLDVPSLRDLASMLRVPVEQWPTADLVATISASETASASGRTVRFTIDVTNRGTRPVTRASVRVRVQGEGGTDILRDFFPDVKAGQWTRLEFNTPLPAGRAIAFVVVEPARSSKVVRELHPRRDPAFTIVGEAR